MYHYIITDLLKILSQLKPLSHRINLYNLEQVIQTYFKSLSPKPRNLQILHALSNTYMTFLNSFSLSYVQNIIFLPVVINLTYLHHKHVPVVLLANYGLLVTQQHSAFHSYFYPLRMVYTGMHCSARCTHRVVMMTRA